MSNAGAGRTALVTGASRGIGCAIARALAARGVRIALHYHSNDAAAIATRAELDGEGHLLCKADLTDAGATARLWHEVSAAFGAIDILVNNAGLFIDHPPLSTDYDAWTAAWKQTLAANLLGPANLSLLAAQAMTARTSPEAVNGGTLDPGGAAGHGGAGSLGGLAQHGAHELSWGRGRIVNISSRGAFRGEPDAPAYGASKAGLNALSQSMAKALAPRGVYVYCLAPGFVATDMAASVLAGAAGADILAQHPLGRIATAEEIARTAEFCALDAPPAMTGSIIDLNGASYLRT
jgi:NAD(P)-dependent dehydrogenase (short-subunit alcohol dehydrogenase family)